MGLGRRIGAGCAALALGLTLGACQTTEGREKESTGTAVGAATGAAAGAAIGDGPTRGRNAIIGGVVGGVIGNRVGAYMDRQEQELREELQGSGVEVERDGDKIQLVMPGDITFETGQSAIDERFRPVLADVARVLQRYDQTGVRAHGFTDSTGSAQFNQLLSEQRAQSVVAFLEDEGVSGDRVTARGFGQSQPVAPNDTAEGRAQNRRVELELYPLAE